MEVQKDFSLSPAPIELDDSINNDVLAQEKIIKKIKKMGFHVVLLIGDRSSGKSSTIASLITLDRYCTKVKIEFCEDIFDNQNGHDKIQKTRSKKIYDRLIDECVNHQAITRTSLAGYFIPIKVSYDVGTSTITKKLVFLDSPGEYQRRRENDDFNDISSEPDEYPDQDPDFAAGFRALLDGVTDPISLILHAPAVGYAVGDTRADSGLDETILSRLVAYRRARKLIGSDRGLFLLTQWDRVDGAHIVQEGYRNPSRKMVEEVLDEHYQRSWSEFSSHLPNKSLMPFSSGHFTETGEIQPIRRENNAFPVIIQYRKTLLNWLLEGAGAPVAYPEALPSQVTPVRVPSPLESTLKRWILP